MKFRPFQDFIEKNLNETKNIIQQMDEEAPPDYDVRTLYKNVLNNLLTLKEGFIWRYGMQEHKTRRNVPVPTVRRYSIAWDTLRDIPKVEKDMAGAMGFKLHWINDDESHSSVLIVNMDSGPWGNLRAISKVENHISGAIGFKLHWIDNQKSL